MAAPPAACLNRSLSIYSRKSRAKSKEQHNAIYSGTTLQTQSTLYRASVECDALSAGGCRVSTRLSESEGMPGGRFHRPSAWSFVLVFVLVQLHGNFRGCFGPLHSRSSHRVS